MKEKALISIVVPIYNADTYLEECLDSILQQTYKNIEIILVNDGSTDRSVAICKSYIEKDNRIKLIEQENAGVSVARNRGMQAAIGEYIVFVDADDLIALHACEIAYRYAKDYDVLICGFESFTRREEINSCEYQIGNNVVDMSYYAVEKWIGSLLGLHGQIPEGIRLATVWCKFYKRSFLENHEIQYPVGLPMGEDMLFNSQVYLQQPRIGYLPIDVYFYRYTPKSAVHRYNPCFIKNDRKFYVELKRILDEKNLWMRFKGEIGFQQLNGLLLAFSNDIFHKDNPKSECEKKADFRDLVSSKEYQPLFVEQIKNFPLEKRIALIFAKNQCYYPLKVMYTMKNIARRIR